MPRDQREQNADAARDPFLATVDAKIAALQALRSSYLAAISAGALGASVDVGAFATAPGAGTPLLGGQPIELPRGALLGKSLPAAIKLYLSAVKRKQTLKEIAAALRDGGVETTSSNFETPISSAINRLKASGEVLRFSDGWALAEFYPESLRNKLSEKSARPGLKKKKPKTKKVAQRTQATPPTPVSSEKSSPSSKQLDENVMRYLVEVRGQSPGSAAIASALGVNPPQVVMAIMRLARHKKIVKNEDGSYSFP